MACAVSPGCMPVLRRHEAWAGGGGGDAFSDTELGKAQVEGRVLLETQSKNVL